MALRHRMGREMPGWATTNLQWRAAMLRLLAACDLAPAPAGH